MQPCKFNDSPHKSAKRKAMTTPPPTSLNLQFFNHSGIDPTAVSIGFVPGASNAAFSIINACNHAALQPLNISSTGTYPFAGNWYTLDQLSDGVTVNAFSGRVYVAYNGAWTVQSPAYEPAQAVTDPNFFLRYDKLEMTFNGQPADVANLTSIDYWSIPLTLTTSQNGSVVQTVAGLLGSANSQSVFEALNALTTPPVSGVVGPGGIDGQPLPATVPGEFQQYGTGPAPGSSFARVIGPTSYPSIAPTVGLPVMPYDTLRNYLAYLLDNFGPGTAVGAIVPGLGNGVFAHIAGQFAGVGPNVPSSGPLSRQSYTLEATIDSHLNITLSGALSGVAGTTSLLYRQTDLTNPSGIYGGNVPYYLNGATTATNPGNDVYGWVGGDLLSGLNIGAVGSTATVGGVTGVPVPTMVGAINSQLWFNIPSNFFFANMQSTPNYNQWAATLAPLSQAYNFAYSDRFAKVFASLNTANIDTLTVVLEPADVSLPS